MEPEEKILIRKKELAERLLEIPIDDLKTAPRQSWYAEYITLLAIRLEPAAGKEVVAELMTFYNKNIKNSERELAILGVIQFVEPSELGVPFNQHLWSRMFINDVRAVFLKQFPSVNYYDDDDITAYWLNRQAARVAERRKIRVAFVVHSNITCDKVLPLYEAMTRREDFDPCIVIHPEADFKNGDTAWKYFFLRYPDGKIYDYLTLMDLRKLEPDYVFFTNPYVRHRPFPSLRIADMLTFTKICMISYGASLAYVFPERLFRDYRNVYENLYALFASAETVKTIAHEQFAQDTFKYRHVEFLGYPALKDYYQLKKEPSKATRILWTPRWLIDDTWGGSHFLEYKDKFNALREKYGKRVELYFRPHMNLFTELMTKNIMTREEILAYKKSLKASGVIQQRRLADMYESIRGVDIFLADYSSILICFFLTGRPIIYCELPNAVPFPEYKEMFAAMYTARSWEEVEHYLAELIAGNDPLFEKRQAIAQKIFDTHKDASERIIDWLSKDFFAPFLPKSGNAKPAETSSACLFD